MKKLLFIAFVLLFVNATAYSQILSIDSALTEANIPDTVNYNDNLNHSVVVNITGGTPYTGTIYILSQVDSSAGFISLDTIGSRAVVNKLNDTIVVPVNEIYNNANGYRVGGNVVVVWPTATGLLPGDDFSTSVYVNEELVGISENYILYNQFSIYPNPSKDYITINKMSLEIQVKRVRIFDINGRIIYNEKLSSKIDISHLIKGAYFLNIELEGDKMLHYKLIKD